MEDPERLITLLEILQAHGVTHYKDSEVDISLSPPLPGSVQMQPKDTGAMTNAPRSAFARLFPGGRPPSFADFKDAGLVTEEPR